MSSQRLVAGVAETGRAALSALGRPIGALFARLGFIARVALILFLSLAALFAIWISLDYMEAARKGGGEARFPAPRQVAAIAELLDKTDPAQREAVLNAVRSDRLGVELLDAPPSRFEERRRFPFLERLTRSYLTTPEDRRVLVTKGDGSPNALRARIDQMDLAVELADGRFALFLVRGETQRRLFGVPVGFLLGASGFVFAALALWAIMREARPLRRLFRSVEDFAEDGRPRSVEPVGAPDLRRLIAANNAMQARIAELLRNRSIMLGAVSHDLRTFLTRLRLRIEALPGEEARARAEADVEAMDRLLTDAIALSRGDEAAAQRAPLDLAALLRQELEARPAAEAERIELALSAEPGALRLNGDAVSLRRLFANLLDNALRYGGRARIAAEQADGWAIIAVEDDGPGVPEDRREEMFAPFARLESSRNRESGGSGLGLAIVRQIAEAHGGRAAMEASPDLGGARVVVRLPIDKAS